MSGILLENITKRFGSVTAVNNLNLHIPGQSFTTLLGPSGCGKTTTLRMIAGLDHPSEGRITINGKPVYDPARAIALPAKKRHLGLVFQSYALWPHLKVFENIAFGLKVAKVNPAEIRERVGRISESLQIEGLLERYPSELSGGQQQRVAIARVLVTNPEVLLLDEPLSNLDAKLRMDMRAELKRIHKELGVTVIYVTHDQLEAMTMSTHVAIMREGVLQQFDHPLSLYNEPANSFVADFIGSPRINLIEGEAVLDGDATKVNARPFSVTVKAKRYTGKCTLGIRPEDFEVSKDPQPGYVQYEVYSVLPAGADWFLRARLGSSFVTVRLPMDLHLSDGQAIWLAPRPEQLKLFDNKGQWLPADCISEEVAS